jgi:hypothetical protein
METADQLFSVDSLLRTRGSYLSILMMDEIVTRTDIQDADKLIAIQNLIQGLIDKGEHA